MPAAQRRSILITIFGIVGLFWFAFHAVEYVYARYDALSGYLPLPAPMGLGGLFQAMPQWAALALTFTIWTGLLGALLLVLADRASVLLLALTLVGALVTLVWGVLAFAQGLTVLGQINPLFFGAGQATVALGLWLFARTAKRYGTL
ncbi:MAG: hypothetical protein JJU07_09590 [Natronohydrobacter sp.]|nr:hypothetical protein [Natronohydrobacter sp.]